MTHPQMARRFKTGASRSSDQGKVDYAGCVSPEVWERYARYMLAHQYEGQRASDNWKRGIPRDVYLTSLVRHVIAAWRDHELDRMDEETWCAILFNAQGYMFEWLHGR